MLGDVITDDQAEMQLYEEDMEEDTARDSLAPADRFVLNAIKACLCITSLELYMFQITDTAGIMPFFDLDYWLAVPVKMN